MMVLSGCPKHSSPEWHKWLSFWYQPYCGEFQISLANSTKKGYSGRSGEERYITLNLLREWKSQGGSQ